MNTKLCGPLEEQAISFLTINVKMMVFPEEMSEIAKVRIIYPLGEKVGQKKFILNVVHSLRNTHLPLGSREVHIVSSGSDRLLPSELP